MTSESDLIAAVYARPDEDVPRLMYADYLDERGGACDLAAALRSAHGAGLVSFSAQRGVPLAYAGYAARPPLKVSPNHWLAVVEFPKQDTADTSSITYLHDLRNQMTSGYLQKAFGRYSALFVPDLWPLRLCAQIRGTYRTIHGKPIVSDDTTMLVFLNRLNSLFARFDLPRVAVDLRIVPGKAVWFGFHIDQAGFST